MSLDISARYAEMTEPSCKRIRRDSPDSDDYSSDSESEGAYTQDEVNPSDLQELYENHGSYRIIHKLVRGRFRVIHKLGHGRNSTIWLCRDLWREKPRYHALKISVACSLGEDCPATQAGDWDWSQDNAGRTRDWANTVCLAVFRFNIEGPNGVHHCTVYPVIGPKVKLWYSPASDGGRFVRAQRMCRDLIRGVAWLHQNWMCHKGE